MSIMSNQKRRLEASNLIKKYKARNVVDGISLSLDSASVVGLLGPNGAGKTTTFYMIAGLIACNAGSVSIDGKEITNLAMHERARQGITYLPQEPSVFRTLTVLENIALVLEERGIKKAEISAKSRALLCELGLQDRANQLAQSLSGGERRRLEVLRALATEPNFVLLDEPFAGVDPLAIAELQSIIRDLKKRGIGVFISDHNVRETLTVCDRAYIVSSGRIVEHGEPAVITNSPVAKKLYLGEDFKF